MKPDRYYLLFVLLLLLPFSLPAFYGERDISPFEIDLSSHVWKVKSGLLPPETSGLRAGGIP